MMARTDADTLKKKPKAVRLEEAPVPGTYGWYDNLLAEFGPQIDLTPEKHGDLCESLCLCPNNPVVQFEMLYRMGLEAVPGLLDRIMDSTPPNRITKVRISRATRNMLAEYLSQWGLVIDRENKGMSRFVESMIVTGVESGKLTPKWLSMLDGLVESPTRLVQRQQEADAQAKAEADIRNQQNLEELREEAQAEVEAEGDPTSTGAGDEEHE